MTVLAHATRWRRAWYMFGKQAAGPDKPGNMGKDQTVAPGAKFARGGSRKICYSGSVPATPGITGSR